MAKALYGHVGIGPDLRLADEVRRLSRRVAELEDELDRLRAENAALASGVPDDLSRLGEVREPALT